MGTGTFPGEYARPLARDQARRVRLAPGCRRGTRLRGTAERARTRASRQLALGSPSGGRSSAALASLLAARRPCSACVGCWLGRSALTRRQLHEALQAWIGERRRSESAILLFGRHGCDRRTHLVANRPHHLEYLSRGSNLDGRVAEFRVHTMVGVNPRQVHHVTEVPTHEGVDLGDGRRCAARRPACSAGGCPRRDSVEPARWPESSAE